MGMTAYLGDCTLYGSMGFGRLVDRLEYFLQARGLRCPWGHFRRGRGRSDNCKMAVQKRANGMGIWYKGMVLNIFERCRSVDICCEPVTAV